MVASGDVFHVTHDPRFHTQASFRGLLEHIYLYTYKLICTY